MTKYIVQILTLILIVTLNTNPTTSREKNDVMSVWWLETSTGRLKRIQALFPCKAAILKKVYIGICMISQTNKPIFKSGIPFEQWVLLVHVLFSVEMVFQLQGGWGDH